MPLGKDVGEIFGGGLQVKFAVPAILPIVAETITLAFASAPQLTGCGLPAAPTVATEVFELVQVASEVTSASDPSAKVPFAVKFAGVPCRIEADGGVIEILTKTFAVVAPHQPTEPASLTEPLNMAEHGCCAAQAEQNASRSRASFFIELIESSPNQFRPQHHRPRSCRSEFHQRRHLQSRLRSCH